MEVVVVVVGMAEDRLEQFTVVSGGSWIHSLDSQFLLDGLPGQWERLVVHLVPHTHHKVVSCPVDRPPPSIISPRSGRRVYLRGLLGVNGEQRVSGGDE